MNGGFSFFGLLCDTQYPFIEKVHPVGNKGDDKIPYRPVHRSTLAEQLQRTLRMPQQSKSGLGKIFGKAARTALSGIAVYVVINVLSGKTGQKRLRQDFAIVTVSITLLIAAVLRHWLIFLVLHWNAGPRSSVL